METITKKRWALGGVQMSIWGVVWERISLAIDMPPLV